MHGMDFTPAPIEDVKGILVLCGELCPVPEGRSRGRSGSYVDHGRQGVRVELGPFAGAVSPAPHRAAGHVTDSRRAVPRGIEIVPHVCIKSEQFSVSVYSAIVYVSVSRGNDLPLFAI